MRKAVAITLIAAGAALIVAPRPDPARGGLRATGTLTLSHAVLTGHIEQVDCPAGTSAGTICFQISNKGVIRGLGTVSEQNLNFVEDPDSSCERWHSNPVLTVAGKGELDLSFVPPTGCVTPTSGVLTASLAFTVTGGSGIYAGASGSGTVVSNGAPGTTNRDTDTLEGSLTVPGLEFDLTRPVLKGATSKTVLAAKKAKFVRVTYAVKARDAGHSVPVRCKPPSGSRFKLGRTRVTCTATDSSGNTATARFTVTVKRRR